MPKVLIVLFLAIMAIHIPGNALNWYHKIPWLDIPMHMAGGVWVGLLFYYIFAIRVRAVDPKRSFSFIILGLGFVAFLGVAWEIYEFLTDIWILKAYPYNNEPGYILYDTHTDFVNDFLGGALALVWATVRERKKK